MSEKSNKNIHGLPVWWGLTLILIATLLLFLPINEFVQFQNNDSSYGALAMALVQMAIAFVGIAWGADIIYYRDKNIDIS